MVKARRVNIFSFSRPLSKVELLTLHLCINVVGVSLQGDKITCTVPITELSKDTVLTCSFPEDLNLTRKSFSVYHYNKKEDSDAVLDCWWYNNKQDCVVKPGILYDQNVSTHLSITFLNVTEENLGSYACQVFGYNASFYEMCKLQVQATSCNIPSVKLLEPTSITCNFYMDINKTKTNFKVVHYVEQNKAGADVLTCSWQDNNFLDCYIAPRFEYNRKVTDRLTITIPRADLSHTGTYLCRLQITENNTELCEFVIDTTNNNESVIIGVLVPLFLLLFAGVFLLLYRRLRKKSEIQKDPEEQELLELKEGKTISDFIKTTFNEMYQDIETRFYFVPSLYLNKNSYAPYDFAGEKVLIIQQSSEDCVNHDEAMQDILQNLRLMADHEKEVMFVISQFQYDNYLSSVDAFVGHQLPMPATLRKQDTNFGDFDFLIVHRRYGLVVVMVKACTVESGVHKKTNDYTKLHEEVKDGIRKLQDAECMIKHLFSDQQWNLSVHKSLFLPNIPQKIIRCLLRMHNTQGTTDVENTVNLLLPKCSKNNPEELFYPPAGLQNSCLCADQLKSSTATHYLKLWLGSTFTETDVSPVITDEQYRTVIYRFCCPASRPHLPLPDTIPRDILPVTLEHAVYLTGELFESTILAEEHVSLLKEACPRVLLCGSPGTGKTRTLVLTGKRWLSQGHDVHIVSMWKSSLAASRLLFEILTETRHESKVLPPLVRGTLFFQDFDLDEESVTDLVNKLSKLEKREELFILCDEAEPDGDVSSFRSFSEKLLERVKNLHLWYTSCFSRDMPRGWKGKHFVRPISCPPTIAKDKTLAQAAADCGMNDWLLHSVSQAPTEGVAVKHVFHSGVGHCPYDPQDCQICSMEVVTFLQTLFTGTATSTPTSDSPSMARSHCTVQSLSKLSELNLKNQDVLVLTECDLKEEAEFFKSIRKSNFNTRVLEAGTVYALLKKDCNDVFISKGKNLFGIKKKVVIYLEAQNKQSTWKTLSCSSADKLGIIRGLTSCTSQLIWVH